MKRLSECKKLLDEFQKDYEVLRKMDDELLRKINTAYIKLKRILSPNRGLWERAKKCFVDIVPPDEEKKGAKNEGE